MENCEKAEIQDDIPFFTSHREDVMVQNTFSVWVRPPPTTARMEGIKHQTSNWAASCTTVHPESIQTVSPAPHLVIIAFFQNGIKFTQYSIMAKCLKFLQIR